MTFEQDPRADWLQVLRRYLGVSIVGNLVWESLQLPLYTLWATGTRREQAFAVLHCTIGDAMIAGLSLLAALALFARATWPSAGAARVYAASLAFGVVYTIFSEWLNTSVRGSWTYSDLMPVVPVIGTGLAPLLQWCVVPTLAQWIAVGRAPWIDQESQHSRRVEPTCWGVDHQEKEDNMSGFKAFMGSPAGLFACLVAAALGIYLLVFHLTHVALVLPYLVLLACPLMHFMHRGHHHHGVSKTDSGTP